MLHIYYGYGKGKTSTINGSAIRAIGADLKVCIYRFLKGRPSSENSLLEKNGIKVYTNHSSPKFVIEMNDKEKIIAKQDVMNTLEHLLENYHKFDLVILDEFLDLCDKTVSLLSEKEMKETILKIKNESNEIMITGHSKIPLIFEEADLITNFISEKHYFDEGVKQRKGLEY